MVLNISASAFVFYTVCLTYAEVWLAMRGTDSALLDRLGRITGGVGVLRPQGTSTILPDLPSTAGSDTKFSGQAPKNSTIPFDSVREMRECRGPLQRFLVEVDIESRTALSPYIVPLWRNQPDALL